MRIIGDNFAPTGMELTINQTFRFPTNSKHDLQCACARFLDKISSPTDGFRKTRCRHEPRRGKREHLRDMLRSLTPLKIVYAYKNTFYGI